MKSYKKIAALLTCSLSLVLMTGCGNNTASTSDPSSEETSSETQSSSSWSSEEETDSETSAGDDESSTTDEEEESSSSSDAGEESSEEEPVHEHTLVYHAPVSATCTQDGTLEYWECTGCGLYFADENAETELTSIVDPATGHDWDTDNIEWTWDGYESATATINCLNGSHPQTVNAEISYEVTTSATCEDEGLGTYTATINFEGAVYTDVKTEVVSATGHDWDTDNIVWSWTGYESATATFTCGNDSSHTIEETAAISSEITTAATCEGAGVRTYTASVTFGGNEYTDTKTEAISATGHDWDYDGISWEWDGYESATATVTCKNDSEHTLVETASITSETTASATCEDAGVRTYTATVNIEGAVYTDVKTEEIAATGHDWDTDNIEWTWYGYESATATLKCLNDSTHTREKVASISSSVTTSATCEGEGMRTYTAMVDFDDKIYTDTKTEVVSATGHDWDTENVEWTWNGYESATATFTCKNDDLHTSSVNATVTDEITTAAACEEKGVRTYTASVTFGGDEYTDVKTEEISATGHDWDTDNIEWTWYGYESATATLKCLNDSTHTNTVDATITDELTAEPTCEGEGVRTYTASITLDGATYTGTKTGSVSATGHDWNTENVEWTWNGYESATATFTCKNDASHTFPVSAAITSKVTKEATCIETGTREYTATASFEELTYTDIKTEEIAATGHSYDEDGKCVYGDDVKVTEGLEYQHNSGYYSVYGIGTATDTEIYIPETYDDGINGELPVQQISSYAFSSNTSVKKVVIPESVTSVGNNAFQNCTSLSTVRFSGIGVTSLGSYLFYGCTSLTSVVLPDGITSIGEYCFYKCSYLASIDLPDTLTSIGQYAFHSCSRLASISIPDGVTKINQYTFYSCSYLASIVLPDGITSIGNDCFYKCSKLASIDLPESLTSLGTDVFYTCTKLTNVVIPDGVESLPMNTFYGCSALTSVTLPDTLTSIGQTAFMNCGLLASINMPSDLTSIGQSAFNACAQLSGDFYIPAGVTYIGLRAFYECGKLTSITFAETEGWWYASSGTATSGTSIDVSDPVKNVDYLTSKDYYTSKYWNRTVG